MILQQLFGLTVLVAECVASAQVATAQDHSQHQQPPTPGDEKSETNEPESPDQPLDHAAMGHSMPHAQDEPRQPLPMLTEADRAAAFPDVSGHAAHDSRLFSLVQFSRLEGWSSDEGTGLLWDGQGWVGGDLDRLWLRSEGERVDGKSEAADVELLYGRAVSRWWDVVAGVRHDLDPDPSRTWAAIGIVGLAPQKFEVEATAYVGESGRVAARFEVEYDVLLTNRLILQPLFEVNLLSKDDVERGLGSGLTVAEASLRLRYEVTRQFAPYLGLVYERAYGDTADMRRATGEDVDDARVVAGLRVWF
jgi:copper resistance protein B